jgi:hypothetical protein
MTRRRLLLAGTIAWVVGYLALYFGVLHGQDESSPAWWYVAVLIVAIGMLCLVLSGVLGRRTLVVATGVLGFAALIAVLSIGILLVPAVVAALIAASTWDQTLRRHAEERAVEFRHRPEPEAPEPR